MTLLSVQDVSKSFGGLQALQDINMTVESGEIVGIMGANGAGKTTTLHTIMGAHRQATGSITFNGHELIGQPAFKVMQHGIGLVPEGRQIFPTLSVLENLKMGHIGRKRDPNHWSFSE